MYIHIRYTCRGVPGGSLGGPWASFEVLGDVLGGPWGRLVGFAVAFGPLSPKTFEILICEEPD